MKNLTLCILMLLFGKTHSQQFEKPRDTLWYTGKPFIYQNHKTIKEQGRVYVLKTYAYADRTIYIKCRLEEIKLLKV